MLLNESPERPPVKAPGRLSQALRRLLMRHAAIAAAEWLADHFRLITLEGPALRDVAWTPGQKIQIAMGSGFAARTYTPIEWNAATGRACILGYEHGEGPGSAWVREIGTGDECDIFGPRASLDLRLAGRSFAVFGDETSIGLACAVAQWDDARLIAGCFEVEDPENARNVVAQLGLGQASLIPRKDDDTHIEAMEAAIPALIAADALFVLTGKASTVQRLRQTLKRHAVPSARVRTKAYWAPGKTGMD